MVDSVPLFSLERQHKALEGELKDAFARVLASGQFVLGSEVDAFEKGCRELLGARHALGISSGTDAILLALMTLDVGPGDEVIVPSYTFFATAGCVARVGARPVFVDVTPCCFNLDPRKLEAAIGKRTKAILPVHLFGQCCDIEAVLAIAKKHRLAVIEDAAQSLSTRIEGKSAGTLGTFGCYSFFPTKNLGALGDAGLLTTEDDALAEKARMLRVHGAKPKYYHQLVGANFRIDALQAALLNVKLPHLASWTQARARNVERYRKALEGRGLARTATPCGGPPYAGPGTRLELPPVCRGESIWNQLVVRVREGKRDALVAFLKEKKVGTEIYYPVALHQQACFQRFDPPRSLPVAEAAARETLALPVFPELRPEEIDFVIEQIARFYA